jgi:hypothetical protein
MDKFGAVAGPVGWRAELGNMSCRDAIFFLDAKDGGGSEKRQEKREQHWPELPFRGALTTIRRERRVDRNKPGNRGGVWGREDFVKNFTIELA